MTEPQADRYLESDGLADDQRTSRLISRGPRWHAWGISGVSLRPLRFIRAEFARATMAWTVPLWLAVLLRPAAHAISGLAAVVRAAVRDRPHAGPRLILDRPADACTDRAGDCARSPRERRSLDCSPGDPGRAVLIRSQVTVFLNSD